jgi:anaphase-promoting complex subunit 5
MPRYLTPSKVTLLALISLYCNSSIPTTATIPLLSFIISHLDPPHPAFQLSNAEDSATTSPQENAIEHFKNALSKHESILPGRSLWDLLLKELWSINCLDALHDFFDSLELLLPGHDHDLNESRSSGQWVIVSRISPLGAFIRRSRLEFTRLRLHDSIALWMAFIKYREPTREVVNPRYMLGAERTSIDKNWVGMGGYVNGSRLFEVAYTLAPTTQWSEMISADDVERVLEFQATKLQRKKNLHVPIKISLSF